ncbi:hypothetical protein QTP86_010985 [Hemibagrus guttatus]|nr:hypothetical protein QTP86_010985 [Hemibagrus guttatus]
MPQAESKLPIFQQGEAILPEPGSGQWSYRLLTRQVLEAYLAMDQEALDWASVVWDMDPQIRAPFTYFTGMMREVFEYPAGGKDISLQLMELHQGSDSAADYAINFRTLVAQSGWNEMVLWVVFRKGLSPVLQTELACQEDATSLSQYVATAIRLDNLLSQHRAGARPPVSARPRPDYPGLNPVSLASGHIPRVYEDFQEVFSRERATRLPEHRAWDCAIDLLPNTSPPKGWVYPLSLPESLINEVFQNILGKCVIAYIDDILVYSTSLEEHVHHVWAVLSRLQQNHLYIKPEKCEFHRTTITFLGYVISRQGVEMDLTKLRGWPIDCFTAGKWRHWLEGACHPFLVLTDHRNLEYLRSSKHLNPRQARWALFFTRLEFLVTYHPETKNSKADTLSRQFETRSECWSHLSVDFLTDLPNLRGITVVMVVVDRFSKACKLIPLKGSPTAMQTAEAMFHHIFQNFVLPEDIVSDRGSQFTSRVWRYFCERLGLNVSLSSGYHPQSNGQAECLIQEIGRFLRSYCSREQQSAGVNFSPGPSMLKIPFHSSTGLTQLPVCAGVPAPPRTPGPESPPTCWQWMSSLV